MSVGVAISTHRRPDLLERAVTHWSRALPDLLVITHDVAGEGVAATKNRGIAALMDAGVDHLFLADDDVWPLAAESWERYVADPASHLMLCWGTSRRIADDGHYTTWSHPRGVLLYVARPVVERVGGMRTDFGRFGHEHVEWSRRIHQAGLTAAPYMDLSDSRRFWHAEDWGRPGESVAALGRRRRRITTVPRGQRGMSEKGDLLAAYDGDTSYVDFRREV